ncbi:hypothetical protein KIW84_071877 [Lathyrus oleraceus]|uniref:Uncharacterized protein n=1 Tax=Pisum sativum TaxID=3888 RepID=A0A9D4ZVA5_PEA|nr:hypothetical protein KIW84_071877 [Pisum sativum]
MEKFLEPFAVRPDLDGVDFKVLLEVDTVLLENSFSDGEIKSSGWDCEDSKSPGPDGKASKIGVFKGFNFKGLYNVDLLQFVDDTLIIVKVVGTTYGQQSYAERVRVGF